MRTPLLWHRSRGPQFEGAPLTEPVRVTSAGRLLRPHEPASARALVLLPADFAVAGLSALLLILDEIGERPRLDRAPICAGMHLLRHGARLDFAGLELWVSTLCSGTEEPYAPEVHGPERHCFRVKAKVKSDEPVVLCPGVPHAACGVLYKAAAWRTVRACANCGHAPEAPAWAPPAALAGPERRSLRELLARAAARRA